MGLSLSQIKSSLESPSKKNAIQRAVALEKRIQFHTETNVVLSDVQQQVTNFLEWVNSLIPTDKFLVFKSLFTLPVPTVSIVEDVYRELERVFYSRNSNSNYSFYSSEAHEDWLIYKRNKLNQPNIWRETGFEKMKVSPNSVVIIDLPSNQTSELPEPYFYWLDISQVIDYSSPDGVILDWIIFKQPNKQIAVFDNEKIRVFKINDKNEITELVSESVHDLGYCPARFFWTSSINKNNRDLKRNPIVKELSNLDWYLFFSTSKKHLDLYAPYPIYSAYEADCDFKNDETGDYCDSGFLRDVNGSYKVSNGGLLDKCPVCSEKRLAGPGSFLEIPAPVDNAPDMRNPVQITTVDADSLKYNVDECDRLKYSIITACVGYGGDVSEKEAINEIQVSANFEQKTAVLNSLKVNFESIEKFVNDTCCKLRYGYNFISSTVSWGTEFYVFTVDDLYKRYKAAKENGALDSELDALSIQIIETEYKNNPTLLERMLILKHLEPFKHLSKTEMAVLLDKNVISAEDMKLKLNFISYIERFERENINIVEFGSMLPFSDKIDKITNKLKDYVKEK